MGSERGSRRVPPSIAARTARAWSHAGLGVNAETCRNRDLRLRPIRLQEPIVHHVDRIADLWMRQQASLRVLFETSEFTSLVVV